MSGPSADRQAHWRHVYATRPAESVSWYRPHLEVSLELLDRGGLNPDSRIIDIGGGASTLVDDLLGRGVAQVTVLDLSAEALEVAQARLGARGDTVRWIAADLRAADLPAGGFDLWHDRAVLHFLGDTTDAALYARQAERAVRPGGHAVVSGFAPDGPERCSGLPVARRSPGEIASLLGSGWTLLEQRTEQHVTPGGSQQSFAYALLRRR
jgi:SAM-dependent methyltransferase